MTAIKAGVMSSLKPIRRLIAGNNAAGESTVLLDGGAPVEVYARGQKGVLKAAGHDVDDIFRRLARDTEP